MNLLIIGGGGIGSWLTARISRLRDFGQLNDISLTLADSDVIEKKNLPYQNFELAEIMDPKALILEDRFNIKGVYKKIETDKDLESFDIIVCAVDNAKTRRLVYKHCLSNNKYFIDLRAEGTAVWGITSDASWSLEKLESTLGKDDETGKSCQLKFELEQNIIQLGNTIIAEIGVQWLLNHLRGKQNFAIFSYRF